MDGARLAGFVWVLALLYGCGKTSYVVGGGGETAGDASIASNSAGAAGSLPAAPGGAGELGETGGERAGMPSVAGAPAILPGTGGEFAFGGGNGGAGAAGAGPIESPSYCNAPLPSAQRAEFASPATVYDRIQRFILGQSLPIIDSNLPAVTTREWAGSTAISMIQSLDVDSPPGLTRFVSSWWPSTPTPQLWGSYFGFRQGTLTDLLQTDVGLPNGSGVLTDPAVLQMSTISGRGAFLLTQLLCVQVPPPPAGTPPAPVLPGLTRRQRRALVLNAPTCAACHAVMDPMGLALEHFATDGTFQTLDNGQPIDSSAVLPLQNSGSLAFTDVADLGRQVATTCEVATCFTRQLLSFAQQSALISSGELDDEALLESTEIARQFNASGLDLQGLVRAVVASDSFLRPQ